MERDKIPLHNEKYSRMNDTFQQQTEVIRKGFFDTSLPVPSHVILNHINSWETMTPLSSESTTTQNKSRLVQIEGVQNMDAGHRQDNCPQGP